MTESGRTDAIWSRSELFFDNRIREFKIQKAFDIPVSKGFLWPSYQGQAVDALVSGGDERRGKLR